MYPACVSAIMDDPGIGLIAMSRDTPVGVAQREIEQSMKIAEAAVRVKKETDKAVCLFSNFSRDFDPEVARYLRENQVPYLQGTAGTSHAIHRQLKNTQHSGENGWKNLRNHRLQQKRRSAAGTAL